MDLLQALAAIPGMEGLVPYLALAVAVCAALATCLPPPAADASGIYGFIYRAVNLLAANVGHARNATAPPTPAAAQIPPSPTNTGETP